MGLAPRAISRLPVICSTRIDGRHRPTGRCRHLGPEGLLGPAGGLAICGCTGESVYLYRCDEDWVPFAGTWHETVEQARWQAAFEYEGVDATWQQHDGPPQCAGER